jgi:hypothetical protein
MCGPRGLQGEPDHLFHNNGGWGKFPGIVPVLWMALWRALGENPAA